MAERKIYGVFLKGARGKWGMTRNKKEAIVAAKKYGGEVRAIAAGGSERYWDAPTFYTVSEHVWP